MRQVNPWVRPAGRRQPGPYLMRILDPCQRRHMFQRDKEFICSESPRQKVILIHMAVREQRAPGSAAEERLMQGKLNREPEGGRRQDTVIVGKRRSAPIPRLSQTPPHHPSTISRHPSER